MSDATLTSKLLNEVFDLPSKKAEPKIEPMRTYGSAQRKTHSPSPHTRAFREGAKADKRWSGSDDFFDDPMPLFMDRRPGRKVGAVTAALVAEVDKSLNSHGIGLPVRTPSITSRQVSGSAVRIDSRFETATIENIEIEKLANIITKCIADVLDGANIIMKKEALASLKCHALDLTHDVLETCLYKTKRGDYIELKSVGVEDAGN